MSDKSTVEMEERKKPSDATTETLVAAERQAIKSGLRAVAYVRLDPSVEWPGGSRSSCRPAMIRLENRLAGTMAALIETERRQKAATAAASLKGVTHRYGKTVALDSVTLEIPGGRMTGLIGPDGVGKSTLPRTIASWRTSAAASPTITSISAMKCSAPS